MQKKISREWKKVFESDLGYIAYELKDLVEKPAVIFLEGGVGAGKTTFTKAFINDGDTFSRSYSILSETRNVLHADLYRLEDQNELIHIELPLYLETKQFFILEWGMKFFKTLYKEIPEGFHYYQLDISINDSSDNAKADEENHSRNFALYHLDEVDL